MQTRDGRLTGVTPFEHDPHPTPLIEAWPEMLTHELRVATPVVRRGWLAGDGGAARGDDSFVQVGWDRALDLVAGELTRVRAEHGHQAVFGGSYGWSSAGRLHHARSLVHRFLGLGGGFTGQVTNYSYGAAMAFLPRILGTPDGIGAALTSWHGIATEGEVLLAFGGIAAKNWEVQSGGFGMHQHPTRMAELAAGRLRMVNISPLASDFPSAEWLPIRPCTDSALVMALTQSVIAAGRFDRALVERLATGFDRYAAYLAGEVDGIAKTPEWAAGITGIPAVEIEALAQCLPGKRVMLTAAWSLQRARHGEQVYWAIIALAAVLGQIGLPGGGFAFGYGSSNGMGNPRYDTPLSGMPAVKNPVGINIPVARIADLLLHPGETIRFNGRDVTYPDTRLVYWAGGNPFHHHQDLNRLRRAFRRPETVIVHEPWWTATARHADIVLPATTPLERNDIGGSSRDPFLLAMHQGVQPVGEARNDMSIFVSLAERLGFADAFTEGRDEDAWLRHIWARSRASLAARGIEAPAFDAFWEQGFFRVPEPQRDFTMFEDFRTDPVAHPMATPSGRMEIFSPSVAAMDDPEQPGHPVWLDPEEWLGASSAKNHPLHLLTPQPARRLHGQMEASSHSRAGKRNDREVMQIHPHDANARGIATGDIVRLFNDRGACLASAEVTPSILRGVITLPTGAAFDPMDATSDRSSNPNVLTLDKGTSSLGQGCSAQSCLVEVERFDAALPRVRAFEPPEIAGT
ncbi:molybdopterin-dependent oxidoreductase [Humitalea sp. 24SJ18S-53]|uniref:molybdopterin-dependent oxidoreductase n=1 Tax=Humitalea sp. 24SJ18S-53 TaxID=3422307 RepID=UPI003D66993C